MGNMTEEEIQQAGREYYGVGGAGEGQFAADKAAFAKFTEPADQATAAE